MGAAHPQRPKPRRSRQVGSRDLRCRRPSWRARPHPAAGARAALGNRLLLRRSPLGALWKAARSLARPLVSLFSVKITPRESRSLHNSLSPRARRRSPSIFGTNGSCSDAGASAWLSGSARGTSASPVRIRPGPRCSAVTGAWSLETGDGDDGLRRAGRSPPPWKRGTGAVRTGWIAGTRGEKNRRFKMTRRGLLGMTAALALAANMGFRVEATDARTKAGCACCGSACACPACVCDNAKTRAARACDCCGTAACCSEAEAMATAACCH